MHGVQRVDKFTVGQCECDDVEYGKEDEGEWGTDRNNMEGENDQ